MAKKLTLKEVVDASSPLIRRDNVVDLINRAGKSLYANSTIQGVTRFVNGFVEVALPEFDEDGLSLVAPSDMIPIRIADGTIDSITKFFDNVSKPRHVISLHDVYSPDGYDMAAFVDMGSFPDGYRYYLCPVNLSNETNIAEIVALCRLAYKNATVATDILPFSNLESLKNMVMSIQFSDDGDAENAMTYEQMAMRGLEDDSSRARQGRVVKPKIFSRLPATPNAT